MLDPIEIVQGLLRKYPHLRYDAGPDWITVHPVDGGGFSVDLRRGHGDWVLHLDGWHEHFADPREALEWLELALSPHLRLRVEQRGGFRHRWTLERHHGDQWHAAGSVGLLFYPFWRPSSVVYLQNRPQEAA